MMRFIASLIVAAIRVASAGKLMSMIFRKNVIVMSAENWERNCKKILSMDIFNCCRAIVALF